MQLVLRSDDSAATRRDGVNRVLARELPNGRRAEIVQESPNLVRVLLYAAGTCRISASYEYDSVDAALVTVRHWASGEEPAEWE
jgi:hypothetical protein